MCVYGGNVRCLIYRDYVYVELYMYFISVSHLSFLNASRSHQYKIDGKPFSMLWVNI